MRTVSSGICESGNQRWTQVTVGSDETAQSGDRFGSAY